MSILLPTGTSPVTIFNTDASGSWGCGAWSQNEWFQLKWDQQTSTKQITVKELIPIIIVAVIWGQSWRGCQVLARYDNDAVVAVLQSCGSHDPELTQLLRC